MGSFISLLRDIRTVYRDLKVTLKLTARIVLKVHGIVEDVEQTVQDLKAAVKGLSSKIQPQDGMGPYIHCKVCSVCPTIKMTSATVKPSIVLGTPRLSLQNNASRKLGRTVRKSQFC